MEIPLTVIVPTCDRSRTLYYTLSTLAAQDYPSLEVIVSDNASTDDTANVIKRFTTSDNRFKMLSHKTRLSMSKHWELALAKATGSYVTFLGDDDGIVPQGCRLSARLLSEAGNPSALVSVNATYHWPDTPVFSQANVAIIPLKNGLERRASRDMLALLRHNQLPYNHLPSLYRSWVKRSAVEAVRGRTTTFFRSCQPDVYSGIALASSMDEYYISSCPLFIEGVSGFSNGARSMQSDLSSDTEFFRDDTIPFHRSIPFCTAHACLAAESLQQCHDAGLIGAEHLFKPKDLIAEIMRGAVALSRDRYDQCVRAVRECGSLHQENEFAEKMINECKWVEKENPCCVPPARLVGTRDNSEALVVDTRHAQCKHIKDFFDLIDDANDYGKAKMDVLKSVATYAWATNTSPVSKTTSGKFGSIRSTAQAIVGEICGHIFPKNT
jgi:glycosyltransferase involved in cell wall biosynthesis